MIFLLAVFKGILGGLSLGPGRNREKLKLPKIPAEVTGWDDPDCLPWPSTDRAHLSIGASSIHTGHTLVGRSRERTSGYIKCTHVTTIIEICGARLGTKAYTHI